eukprot:scpid72342/ scgid31980/ 
MSVWDDPQVQLRLGDVRDKMDSHCDELRNDCMSRQLIDRVQNITLRCIKNPRDQLEHLISMLAVGSGQSFQIFLEILKKQCHNVMGKEAVYDNLATASSQYVSTSTYDQEVHRLAYLKKTSGTDGKIILDQEKLRLLDTRHNFVRISAEKVPNQGSAKEQQQQQQQ